MAGMRSAAVSDSDTGRALAALEAQLEGVGAHCIFVFYGCRHDDARIHAWLKTRFPGAAVIGGTSCNGFMTETGVWDGASIGLLLIDDEAGDYGAAAGTLGEDPAGAAERLLGEALSVCGCDGQLPELIWVYQEPGSEEMTMQGLRRVVGDRCPIIGGSSADDSVSGEWRQMGPDGPLRGGMVVGVLFPSGSSGYAFQGGYEPAGPSGIVTGVGFRPAGDSGIVTGSAGRELLTIDGQPAAEVYRRWTGNIIDEEKLSKGGTILAETTMFPIAVDAGRVDGVTHYLLVHPESITGNGALKTFCELQEGSRVFAMKGDRQRLVDRAGRVADQARRALPAGSGELAGALLVYCGGCKMAVGDDIGKVATAVSEQLDGAPFIGCFTFGEQGHLINRNVHGNLMISAVALGN
jgi:hypothetical protein